MGDPPFHHELMDISRVEELNDLDLLADLGSLGIGDRYDPTLDTSSPVNLQTDADPTPSQDATTSHPTSPFDMNETYQAPYTPSVGDIPLNDEPRVVTPPSSSSSLNVSNHSPTKIPKPKHISGGNGRVSSGSSKKQKPEKHAPRNPSVVSVKSSVVPKYRPRNTTLKKPLVTPEKHRGKAFRVPPVDSFHDESSLDMSAHKRKRSPYSPRKKSPPIIPAPRPPSPTTSNGSHKSHSSMQSRARKKKRRERRADPKVKTYVEKTDEDVLLGRGGCSNHHPGNKAYRKHVLGLQKQYQALGREEKKPFSEAVVKWVQDRGGRFLKRDYEKDGHWYEVTDVTARVKVSQALREDHTPEGRAEKKHRWKNAKKRR